MFNAQIQSDLFKDGLEDFLDRIGGLTHSVSESIPKSHKHKMSQYFTHQRIALQMAKMLDVPGGAVIGDHGAGTGILGASLIAHTLYNAKSAQAPLQLRAYEIDELLKEPFNNCINQLNEFAVQYGQQAPSVSVAGDFTEVANYLDRIGVAESLDFAITNPPYQKLNQQTPLAKLMKEEFVSTPNLYAVFILLSVLMLKPGGELVAIVPRSFTNGDYYKSFRRWICSMGCIDWFVRYKSRSNLFNADNVLQENVIFRFRKGVPQPASVRVSLCETPDDPAMHELVIPSRDVMMNEAGIFMVPATPDELAAFYSNREKAHALSDLGLKISTGKFEEHRHSDYVKGEIGISGVAWAPVVYSQHWSRGETTLSWSPKVGKKDAVLEYPEEMKQKLYPRGNYILLKRISANDDKTGRCHPCLVTEDSDLPGDYWSFDNHVQVIQGGDRPLTKELAVQITQSLKSDSVEELLKVVSGTTQLNKSDLMQIRFDLNQGVKP